MDVADAMERISLVADTIVAGQVHSERFWPWTWGPALFGHAVLELADHTGRERHLRWAGAWADHHLALAPPVDQSDRVAPGLVTAGLWRRTGEGRYRDATERITRYLVEEPKLVGDATNHLGGSMIGKFYPRSVWVDSLMMFGVLAARWGAITGDTDLLELAARQPQGYADLLQAPNGLWQHSWWERTGRAYPTGVYWGRGNGWVVAALPMIMEELAEVGGHGPQLAEAEQILTRTSRALLPLQRPDGTFGTLLTEPGGRELSATALIGAGWLHGVRLGVLPRDYIDPALRAVSAVNDAIQWRVGPDGLRQWSLPGVSGPTIPVPGLPRTGYRVIPRGRNHSYGVAAQLFAVLRAAQVFQVPRGPGLG